MRILLTANASYVPPRGGATRSNLAWLDSLAAAGHNCRVVAAELSQDRASKLNQIRDEEIAAAPEAAAAGDGVEAVRLGEVLILSAAEPHRRTRLLAEQIRGFRPDWVLVSSEDLGQVLLAEAAAGAPGRVIYLAHTPQLFPFGPASWNLNPEGAENVRTCAGIVAIGHHAAGYIEQQIGRKAAVIHPPIYGGPPFEKYPSAGKCLVTMVNPCAIKGISIFLALARRFPQYSFAALEGWGTTAADRAALGALANVRLLKNVKSIGQVLQNTRVLLMPSLWYEGFGLSVTQAMLGGVPVISSDSGGLLEAKLGTRFVLPVRPIERYESAFDEHGLPTPVVAEQDIEPWAEALEALLTERSLYEQESDTCRERALRFVSAIRPGLLDEFLRSLAPASSLSPLEPPRRPAPDLAALSPEKRALLMERLRQKRQGA